MSPPPPAGRLLDASVVVPIFNEVGNVALCYSAVTRVMDDAGLDYEIVFVDDGSTDGSTELMRNIHERDPRVLLIRVAQNVGQQRALAIGLGETSGRAVITFDGDLQYEPQLLVDFTQKIAGGAELVSGIRSSRHDSWTTRFPSWIGNALINSFLQIKQQDFGSVKAYSRELVHEILARDHQLLCIPAMAWTLASGSEEVAVLHRARTSGRSKWAVLQRVQLFLDVLATYGRRPFQWLLVLGLVSLMAGLATGFALVGYRLVFPDRIISGVLVLFDLTLIFVGLNFVVLAYIGEFVLRSYRESLKMAPGRVIERRRHPSGSQEI